MLLLQVVWKDSQRVGFGIATGSDGMTKVVAQYQPCGNMNFNSASGAQANVDMADSKKRNYLSIEIPLTLGYFQILPPAKASARTARATACQCTRRGCAGQGTPGSKRTARSSVEYAPHKRRMERIVQLFYKSSFIALFSFSFLNLLRSLFGHKL